MKRFLKHAATATKWAALAGLVAFVSYFAGPFSGWMLANTLTDHDDE